MTKKHKDNLPKHTFTFAACINELLKSAPLRLLLMTFLCFELAWSLYFQSLAILLVQNFQLDNKFIGLFCAYVGLVLSLSLFYGVKLVIHYFELANVILPCFVMGMIALLFGFYFNGLWVQMIIAIPVALMVGLCYATLVTLASDYAGKNKQGILMGATDSLLALAFTITAFLGGILTVTNALLPELVAAGFLLLAGICFWRFRGVA
jgi:predicted MFS family arabinose efflux permease